MDSELSIKSRIAASLLAADQQDRAALAALWAVDAELQAVDGAGQMQATQGREAVVAALCSGDASRIQFAPAIAVSLVNAAHVEAVYSVFLAARGANPPAPMARQYRDHWRLSGAEWHLVKREIGPFTGDPMECLDALVR